MRNSAVALGLLAALLAYGVWRLFNLRFASGDIYPAYSSLRSDAQGTRALYESLGALEGLSVTRSYRPPEELARPKQTILFLGISPKKFEFSSEKELEEFEGLASSGARVVIGLRETTAEGATRLFHQSEIEKRWHVRVSYPKIAGKEEDGSTPVLAASDPAWHGSGILERSFGSGTIVLMPTSYPLGNAALERKRDTSLILSVIGSNRTIVFDENHLGVVENGSVAGLARKYRLQGLAGSLLLLAVLFIWKNSVSLLPARAAQSDQEIAPAKDAFEGFANLLRRNIPKAEVVKVCVSEWEKSRQSARYAAGKLDRIRQAASRSGEPVERYREISAILAERNG